MIAIGPLTMPMYSVNNLATLERVSTYTFSISLRLTVYCQVGWGVLFIIMLLNLEPCCHERVHQKLIS